MKEALAELKKELLPSARGSAYVPLCEDSILEDPAWSFDFD